MAKEFKNLYWEDVNEGDSVTPVSMPITMTRLVLACAGNRDFAPIHHDVERTQKSGSRTAFTNTMFQQGLAGRTLTDWAGPKAFLRKLGISMRGSQFLGTTVTVTGKVTKKYKAGDESLIDLVISMDTEDGHCTDATATLRLPSKG